MRQRGEHYALMLMPKAPLFFDHFDWLPIGDSEMIVATLCRELALLAVRCERRRQACS
jgi:hypothetical protein